MARTIGAKNILPSQQDERALIDLLKVKAEQGDVNAAGWLLVVKNFKGKPPLKIVNGQVIETRG